MPIKTAYEAKVQHIQILDENGNFDEKLGKDLLTDADVKSLYEQMILSREFDEVAFKLQRTGRLGTFPQTRVRKPPRWGQRRR
jgi:pyruvate dehydrogenase E1 component alpha subunit